MKGYYAMNTSPPYVPQCSTLCNPSACELLECISISSSWSEIREDGMIDLRQLYADITLNLNRIHNPCCLYTKNEDFKATAYKKKRPSKA